MSIDEVSRVKFVQLSFKTLYLLTSCMLPSGSNILWEASLGRSHMEPSVNSKVRLPPNTAAMSLLPLEALGSNKGFDADNWYPRKQVIINKPYCPWVTSSKLRYSREQMLGLAQILASKGMPRLYLYGEVRCCSSGTGESINSSVSSPSQNGTPLNSSISEHDHWSPSSHLGTSTSRLRQEDSPADQTSISSSAANHTSSSHFLHKVIETEQRNADGLDHTQPCACKHQPKCSGYGPQMVPIQATTTSQIARPPIIAWPNPCALVPIAVYPWSIGQGLGAAPCFWQPKMVYGQQPAPREEMRAARVHSTNLSSQTRGSYKPYNPSLLNSIPADQMSNVGREPYQSSSQAWKPNQQQSGMCGILQNAKYPRWDSESEAPKAELPSYASSFCKKTCRTRKILTEKALSLTKSHAIIDYRLDWLIQQSSAGYGRKTIHTGCPAIQKGGPPSTDLRSIPKEPAKILAQQLAL